MRTRHLIDSIVQQTTILIAELATAAGLRAPLSHVANQTFLELARAIDSQGVSRKVAADMFGLALRSYQLKVQRLEESATSREQTLWEAIYEHIVQQQLISRADLLLKFCHDDSAMVRSILNDLVDSGLIFQTGSGQNLTYRAASDEEVHQMTPQLDHDALRCVVWLTVYRNGPSRREHLAALLNVDPDRIQDCLVDLVKQGVCQLDHDHYSSSRCFIERDNEAGWGAAVIDHYRAVVVAMCLKLREKETPTLPPDVLGGSTYSFDLNEDHPFETEVLGLLREFRERLSELRQRVTTYNESTPGPYHREVTFYFGQSVRPLTPSTTTGDPNDA